jgi:hypothetical protein
MKVIEFNWESNEEVGQRPTKKKPWKLRNQTPNRLVLLRRDEAHLSLSTELIMMMVVFKSSPKKKNQRLTHSSFQEL